MERVPPFRIRRATEEDGELFYRVKKEAMEEYVAAAFGGWDEGFQRTLHEKRFHAHQAGVILADGEPAGTIRMKKAMGEIRLLSLFLLPEWQGKGVGERILGLVLLHADRLKRPVRLSVLRANPRARRFWERSGFQEEGATETHDLLVRSPEEGHVMAGAAADVVAMVCGVGAAFIALTVFDVHRPSSIFAAILAAVVVAKLLRFAVGLPAERRALRDRGARVLPLTGWIRRAGVFEGGVRLAGRCWFLRHDWIADFEERGTWFLLRLAPHAPSILPAVVRARIRRKERAPLARALEERLPYLPLRDLLA